MEDKLGGGSPKIGDSLRMKCARGGTLLGVGTVSEHGLRFVNRMILTRLLAPEHLGLMAIVMVVSLGCMAFTEIGVKQSVIQNKKGARLEYLNVAWWFQALRGLVLYSAAFLLTPYLCNFYFAGNQELLALYAKPEILRIFRVAFLAILFKSLISPRVYVLEKEFRFGKSVFLIQGSAILATLLTIVLVFYIRNVWALVIGFASEGILLCLLSYILCPFLPRLKVDRDSLREIATFARGMLGLPILSFIAFQTDVMVLGKVMPMVSVGMYVMAIKLSQIARTLFAKTAGPVLLPAFAEKRDSQRTLHAAVLKLTKTVAFIGLPLVVFMSMCARSILSVVYGPAYGEVAIPFGLLSFCMLFSIQSVVLASMYMAIGQPHLHRRSVMLLSLIIVGLIYPAVVYFGLIGAAAVVALSNFAALLVQVFWCRRVIDLKFSRYMRSYIPGLLLALPVIGIVGLVRLSGVNSPISVLIGGAFAFAAAFVVGVFILARTNKPSTITKDSEDKLDYLSSAEVRSV